MMRVENIGLATLYLGDCRDVLPTLARPDAIVSDPPYGQSVNVNIVRKAGRTKPGGGPIPAKRMGYPAIQGDDRPFDPSWMLTAADRVLLWGAHKFGERLPFGRTLVWDKLPTGKIKDQGCGETAWTNVAPAAPLRIYRHLWDGLSIAGGYETRDERCGQAAARRHHPTQKPVDLMSWCIGFLSLPVGAVLCDPYMGAGSTGIAAVRAGYRFIGVEVEPTYFDAACRRIDQAQRQGEMLALQSPPAKVEGHILPESTNPGLSSGADR